MAQGGRSIRRAAEALADQARRVAEQNHRPVELAIVRTVDPLTAELVDGRLTLGEDVLILGASVRKYDARHGLKPGDALVVVQLSSDDYVAVDVQSDQEVLKGVGSEPAAGTTKPLTGTANLTTGAVTVDMPVFKWLEAFDADGEHLGWVPVFSSKT